MGQTITINTIMSEVPKRIPGLSPSVVINARAAYLPQVAPSPEALIFLRMVWNTAIRNTMILSVSLVALSLPFTLGMEWLNTIKIASSRNLQTTAHGGHHSEADEPIV